MNAVLAEFGLKVPHAVVHDEAENYRPSTWPPTPDWPVVIDKDGKVVSRWSDPVWDLTPWSSKRNKLNFGDGSGGRGESIDTHNADLLRLCMGWLIWGPRGYRKPKTILNRFGVVRNVMALCSKLGISATKLMQFPKVLDELPNRIASSKWEETIAVLHRLYDAREFLGFTILDAKAIARLSELAVDHETIQTAYIPPRIWVYQVSRLRECLDDFVAHNSQIERCFRFCLDAYVTNFGSLQGALSPDKDKGKVPFTSGSARRPGCVYVGTFAETARRYGIHDLLKKWVVGWEEMRVPTLSSYLSLVTVAGIAYIANFTLQRKDEAAALRTDCLMWEDDEKLGRVPIIRGETTKTDFDADARWVASPSVQVAVDAVSAIARLRATVNLGISAGLVESGLGAPLYLLSRPTEPWGGSAGRERPHGKRGDIADLRNLISGNPRLFAEEQMRITEEDLKIAFRLTPNLPADEFAVGKVWPLAWHQYRRTGAVNMFASGLISDSSMQQQMKHLTRLMPLYYGQGHTRLHLNEEVEKALLKAMYESVAHRLKDAVSNRFVSPHSATGSGGVAVQVIAAKDIKTLSTWAKDGRVNFRENRLGGCMKPGPCEYGGIESVARCGGGDGGRPCKDVLYDRQKADQVRSQVRGIEAEMSQLAPRHPRHAALDAERIAMENYLYVAAK